MNNPPSDIGTKLSSAHLDIDDGFWHKRFQSVTSGDVETALSSPAGTYSPDKLTALISPAAEGYLEQIAQLSHDLTRQRFGKTISLYAPLYLSNFCTNNCRYCGFNQDHDFVRTRLTIAQALAESDIIAANGFRDLLLVSGEDRQHITVDYLCELADKLRDNFSSISVEIFQLTEAEYSQLASAGVTGVTIYQETYDRKMYSHCHRMGLKSDYDRRLSACDDIGFAGLREIGLGVLLGLTDWRRETLALAFHCRHLMKRHWRSRISFSFPRLRPAHGVCEHEFKHFISDRHLVQMITALRLCFADAGLILSTRESAVFRDNLLGLGITKISAGSKTSPGGYGQDSAVEQFEIDDNRTPVEISERIKSLGFESVWKDFDRHFTK